MGAGDVARAEHHSLTTKALKIRRFGAERHCFGTMASQSFRNLDQIRLRRLLERRYFGEQRCVVDTHLMLLGQGYQLAADRRTQYLGVHARQRTQVEFQGALATDTVGVVATMDTPKSHQGIFLPERKNSFADAPAVLEANTPINIEMIKKAAMIAQSMKDIFIMIWVELIEIKLSLLIFLIYYSKLL